jgi:hypothetical protein
MAAPIVSMEMEPVKSIKLMTGTLIVVSYVGAASASQVASFETPLDDSTQIVSAGFAVNRDLGRAWIELQIQSTAYVGDVVPEPEVITKMVEGLYYDPALKQVLYRSGEGTTVCAEDSTFLWFTSLKSTDRCRLITSTEMRKIDDGFEVQDHAVSKVVFDVETAGDSRQAAMSTGR